MPSASHLHPSSASNPRSRSETRKRSWESRLPFFSSRLQSNQNREEALPHELPGVSTNASSTRNRSWWKIRLFKGMANDIRRRASFYLSDWQDAWNYRVIPATVYMYFAKQVAPNCTLFAAFDKMTFIQTDPEVSYSALLCLASSQISTSCYYFQMRLMSSHGFPCLLKVSDEDTVNSDIDS